MNVRLEQHIEHLQAFISQAWNEAKNCPCLAVFIDKENKTRNVAYPLELGTLHIRKVIIDTAEKWDSEFVFTVYPSRLFEKDGKLFLDSLNESVEVVEEPNEFDCLAMICNECKGTTRRVWAAIVDDIIGEWVEFDYLTLTANE
jgi:hypothetical protein